MVSSRSSHQIHVFDRAPSHSTLSHRTAWCVSSRPNKQCVRLASRTLSWWQWLWHRALQPGSPCKTSWQRSDFFVCFFFFFAFKGENIERSESTRNSSQRFMRKCLTPLVIFVCGQVFHLIVYFVYVRSMQKYTVLCIVPLVGITVYCCIAIVKSHRRLTFTW